PQRVTAVRRSLHGAEHGGCHPSFERHPRAVEPFLRIAGLLRSDALAPPLHVVAHGAHQDGPLVGLFAEARPEGTDEGEGHFAKLDGPDPQRTFGAHGSASERRWNTYRPFRSIQDPTSPLSKHDWNAAAEASRHARPS